MLDAFMPSSKIQRRIEGSDPSEMITASILLVVWTTMKMETRISSKRRYPCTSLHDATSQNKENHQQRLCVRLASRH